MKVPPFLTVPEFPSGAVFLLGEHSPVTFRRLIKMRGNLIMKYKSFLANRGELRCFAQIVEVN